MPFESEAQRRYLYANEPEVAREFERETPEGADLPKYKHRNARNIPDDEWTMQDFMEDSDVAFVSPDVASTDPRWTSDIPEHMLCTMDQAYVEGGHVMTRHKSDTHHNAGDEIDGAGTA